MTHFPDRPQSSLRKGMVVAVIGFTILFAGFSALGIWQVKRLFWKLDLIEQVSTRVTAAPVAAPEPATPVRPAQDQYRHVLATGIYDHSKETLVKAVTEVGAGYWVLTPLKTDRGFNILINRGFVTPDRARPDQRPDGQVEGPQTVAGLLRISEPKGGFLRENDAAADRWFSRDVGALAKAKSVPAPVATYFIDAEASNLDWPRGGMTVIKFANSHLVYALTWFALAGMSLLGLWLFIREDRRRQGRRLGRA